MSEPLTKSLKVTFQNTLPLGTRGTFTHDKELWIAYPATKNQRLFAVTDRLLGVHKAIIRDSLALINDHPEDAPRLLGIIERATAALALHDELLTEKTEARVS